MLLCVLNRAVRNKIITLLSWSATLLAAEAASVVITSVIILVETASVAAKALSWSCILSVWIKRSSVAVIVTLTAVSSVTVEGTLLTTITSVAIKRTLLTAIASVAISVKRALLTTITSLIVIIIRTSLVIILS